MLLLLIVTLLYVCYAKYVCKKPVVKIGGYGFLIVITGSMDPTIEEDELIIIKECKEYSLDDIVTYRDIDGNLITHRIVQIDEYGFMSKGDSNEIIDDNTSISNIEGKVVYHSKVLGKFVLYYLKFIIVAYLAIWVVLYFKDICMKEMEDDSKKE